MATAKEWFTTDEAAAYLGVSRRTVYKLSTEGRLVPHLVGRERGRRFRRADLDSALTPLPSIPPAHLLAAEDPVLGNLWDNDDDAAYDAL